MPYYDRGNTSLTEASVEYIDDLQCIIDEYGDTVAIQIVGDFNVYLPNQVNVTQLTGLSVLCSHHIANLCMIL